MQAGREHLHEAMGQMKSGLVVTPPVADAWAAARDAEGGWVTCAYDPAAKDTVVLKATGSGGWAEASATLGDADIVFGACAFKMGGQRRLFFFSWVGPSTSPLKRGKVPLQRGAVYKVFEGACADLSLAERDDLAPGVVGAKLSKVLSNAAVEL